MGRFAIEFTVANNEDLVKARGRLLEPSKVRRASIQGTVDPGAALLVLPRAVADQLGVPKGDKVKVEYADRRSATRDTVEQVYVEIQGRHGVFNAIVEPSRKTALIGAIILEAFDLLVDSRRSRLVPRDPRMIVSEIE